MTWAPKADTLDGILAVIGRLVSVDAALKVAELHGGRDLYIPKAARMRRDHWLARTIGFKAACLVAASEIGGDSYRVPMQLNTRRKIGALRLRAQGASTQAIAGALGISRALAANLVAGVPPGDEPAPAEPHADDRCPVCGHRQHRRHAAAGDDRQLALPMDNA